MEKAKRFAKIFWARFTGSELPTTSVVIAYYLLLSLFPLLIALGNLLPYFNIDPASILNYLDTVVPAAIMPVLSPIVESLLTSSSGGLLSIGVVAAIWSSSRGINQLRRGINKAYGISDSGLYIVKRFFSIFTILFILLFLAAFAIVFSFGEMLLESLSATLPWAGNLFYWLVSLKWPVALLFLFSLLALVYRVTPDIRLRLRHVLPGAALATVLLLLLVQAFTVYIRFSAQSYSGYGVIGAFIVFMFWLHFSAMIVLGGAVLNASVSEYRFGHAQEEHSRVDIRLEKTRQSLLRRIGRAFKRKPPTG